MLIPDLSAKTPRPMEEKYLSLFIKIDTSQKANLFAGILQNHLIQEILLFPKTLSKEQKWEFGSHNSMSNLSLSSIEEN